MGLFLKLFKNNATNTTKIMGYIVFSKNHYHCKNPTQKHKIKSNITVQAI